MLLLATGLSEIEKRVESIIGSVYRCHHRSVLLDMVKEVGIKKVILSPCLLGEESMISDLIRPLRENSVDVIFLPGNIEMPDAREWMIKLIPMGVYNYVFDPVTAESIVESIQNPKSLNSLPPDVVHAALGSETSIEDVECLPEEKSKSHFSILDRLLSFLNMRPKDITSKNLVMVNQKDFIYVDSLQKNCTDLKIEDIEHQWICQLGKCILIDADPAMILSKSLSSNDSLWKNDWRLGISAEPLSIMRGVRFYGLSPELGPLDTRDYEVFGDFVTSMLSKGRTRVVVIVGDQKMRKKLVGMGAVYLDMEERSCMK
jgi:hypothetical protein